jgi:hypothetical protein
MGGWGHCEIGIAGRRLEEAKISLRAKLIDIRMRTSTW